MDRAVNKARRDSAIDSRNVRGVVRPTIASTRPLVMDCPSPHAEPGSADRMKLRGDELVSRK